MKAWTDERLRALDQGQLHNLRLNAERSGDTALVQAIEGLGLPYADPAGLKLNTVIGRAITRIIYSEAGTAAALEATENGRPALEGIDPLLQSELGDDYRKTYEATAQAGYVLAGRMRKLGYLDSGSARLREGCVAKSGIVFAKNST
jgi:hypothetical protein